MINLGAVYFGHFDISVVGALTTVASAMSIALPWMCAALNGAP